MECAARSGELPTAFLNVVFQQKSPYSPLRAKLLFQILSASLAALKNKKTSSISSSLTSVEAFHFNDIRCTELLSLAELHAGLTSNQRGFAVLAEGIGFVVHQTGKVIRRALLKSTRTPRELLEVLFLKQKQ